MSFQFRKKKYKEKEVLVKVREILATNKQQIKKEVTKAASSISCPSEKTIAMYGDYMKKQCEKQIITAKKKAVTKAINNAFEQVIGGGIRNNPHAPDSVSKISTETLQDTLSLIRKTRVGTVRRAYSQR